jgi:hypothetical protein
MWYEEGLKEVVVLDGDLLMAMFVDDLMLNIVA